LPGWNVYSRLAAIREAAELQAGVSLAPCRLRFPASGGEEELIGRTVVMSSHWWQAYRGEEWITITCGGPTGDPDGRWIEREGNGFVEFRVEENSHFAPRTGQNVIGGTILTVTQDGTDVGPQTPSQTGGRCGYSITPGSQTFRAGSGSGSGSVSVTAQSGCTRTATSNAGWITITSGASETGIGTVSYSVAANVGTGTRTGTLTIAGQTFSVTQHWPT